MKILILALMTYSAASFSYCTTTVMRPGNTEHSFCHVWVKHTTGSYYGSENFNARFTSASQAQSALDCSNAKAKAMAECEDYKKYEAQGHGTCSETSRLCRDYIVD